MPAYGSVLSDEAIRAVLAYIKSSWPHQALQAQKDMTLKQPLNDQASFYTRRPRLRVKNRGLRLRLVRV